MFSVRNKLFHGSQGVLAFLANIADLIVSNQHKMMLKISMA